MKNFKVFTRSIILILFISILFVMPCYANSAEPPSILIIVPNAPDNLEIKLNVDGEIYQGRKTDKVIESHYTFYSREVRKSNNYKLMVNTKKEEFEINLNQLPRKYNNIFTLNLKTQNLTEGKLLSRSISLILIRLILTLIIEATVFWLFRFRNKKSWICFIIINIITQGALNIWINGFSPSVSYLIFSLIFAEIFIFIAEVIGFLVFCKEHSRMRRVLFVITANFLSLVAGRYIITILPI